MRSIRVLTLNLFLVLSMELGVTAFSQVTVNAPKGLLNRDKPSTSTTVTKEKPKAQEPVKKPEPKSGETISTSDNWSELPQSVPSKTETKAQPKKKRLLTDADRKNYRFSDQAVKKRVTGYRIQVLFSSGRQARAIARERAKELALRFPQYRSYISYNAPQWRLRIGDFKNRGDAAKAPGDALAAPFRAGKDGRVPFQHVQAVRAVALPFVQLDPVVHIRSLK